MKTVSSLLIVACFATLAAAEPIRLRVDFSKPDGLWNMPVLALGQGGLQSDPMIEPHIKELRQLRPRTIRLFLSNQFYTRTVVGLLRGDPDAQVGGPAVASADSFLVEGLIGHCATQSVPLHFISWHLYSDSPGAHAGNIAKQRARLARFPQLQNVKLFISEWNMDLMRPNLAPGFQPCFVLETMRRYGEAKLDMAAGQRAAEAQAVGYPVDRSRIADS